MGFISMQFSKIPSDLWYFEHLMRALSTKEFLLQIINSVILAYKSILCNL